MVAGIATALSEAKVVAEEKQKMKSRCVWTAGVIVTLFALPWAPVAAAEPFDRLPYGWEIDIETDVNGNRYCALSQRLERTTNNGAAGLMILSQVRKGPAVITIGATDWRVRSGPLGSVAVEVDGRNLDFRRLAAAEGVFGNTIILEVQNAYDFWMAFVAGNQMMLRLPNDSVAIDLTGSRRAFGRLLDCSESLRDAGKIDPFGQ